MYALAEMIDMKCLVDARNCFLRCTLVEILRAWSRNNLVFYYSNNFCQLSSNFHNSGQTH